MSTSKRKAEGDFHALQEEIEELENIARNAEEKANKAGNEVNRLVSELNTAHQSALNSDKSRAMLAKQVSELQARQEDAEAVGGKGLKNQIRKLEQRVSVGFIREKWVDETKYIFEFRKGWGF